MLTEERRTQFKDDVARQKLRTDQGRFDGALRVVGVLMMLAGVIGAFVTYSNSLAMDDLRNVASAQVVATAFAALTVMGAALHLTSALARLMRLWLLRQLAETQQQADRLTAALEGRQV